MIVDAIMQEAIIALASSGIHAYLFPELKFSVASDHPVGIRYDAAGATRTGKEGHYMTFLTGRIDYLALGFDTEVVDKAEMLSQKTLRSLLCTGPFKKLGGDAFSCLKFFDIEAKIPQEGLASHKPQVIAETLAT